MASAIAAVLSAAIVPTVFAADEAQQLTEVVVTGSRIRGAAPVGSSVIGLDRTAIELSPALTTDRIIKELPLVADLGVTEATRGQNGGSGNIVWGNTINLHGIGPYATLVLLDGHRTTSNSRSVDPSMIPSLALERIEIVADGASAVYGSDAIAGVVNLIPRRNLDGVDASFHYGDADGFHEYQVGFAAGHVWDSGQMMVAFENVYRSNLNGDDRDYFTGDQTPFGGGDHSTSMCSPGTIVDGTTTYAIPAGGVTNTNAAALVAGTANKCSAAIGQDLLPEQKYTSIYTTVNQEFTDWLEFFGDGFYSKREFTRQPAYFTAALRITNANPYFVTIPGSASTAYTVNYNFMGELGRDTQMGSSTNWEVTPGLRFKLPHDIRAELLFTYGKSDDQSNSYHGLTSGALSGFGSNPDPNAALDPFGLHRTSQATLTAISNQIFLAPTLNTFKGYEARLDGELFRLPGGDMRFAAGYEGQDMDVDLGLGRGNPGTAVSYRNFTRHVDSAYAELIAPLVGGGNAIPGIAKMDVTASIRYDKYDDVGSTTNPKFGLNYSPVDSLALRGSYGTSFRAPLIAEIYGNSNALFGQNYTNPAGGAALLGFALSGGNSDLKPEEATTWSVGIDWKPSNDTSATLTFFNVTYEKQVANFLSNLAVLAIESDVPPGIILHGAAAGARVAQLYPGVPLARGSFPTPGDPTSATLFVDGRSQNLGTSVTRGLDFQLDQRVDIGAAGQLKLNVGGTYLTKYEVSLTPNGPRTDRLNTINFPLKLKGRASVAWDVGPVTSRLTFNYVNGYDNTAVTPTQKVDSFTPVDLRITLRGDDVSWLGSFGEGMALSLEAQNLFDEDPPFVDLAQSGNGGGGFDPSAANPIGRLVGINIRKSWR